MSALILDEQLTIEQVVAVARHRLPVEFSHRYRQRVNQARVEVDQWLAEERVVYGVNTGFGALSHTTVSRHQVEQLQKNIIFSHAASVGEPLSEESVRALMLLIINNIGKGYSGVRLSVVDLLRCFLNRGLSPHVPRHGSVGYLCVEAHVALAMLGEGHAYWQGVKLPAVEALRAAGLKPVTLVAKEGLSLISATTSPTALACLALYDMERLCRSADVVAAITVECLGAGRSAYEAPIMEVRPHPHQGEVAAHMRSLLQGSKVVSRSVQLQDALSLRCVPQVHGAVRKIIADAWQTVSVELLSCCDNPIVWQADGESLALSNGNPDATCIGLAMDSAVIAMTTLASISERRNNRMLDEHLSGMAGFLTTQPGVNSGLMISQYSQAGIINEMRTLCQPATIDNISTSAAQEDYVSMAYNAALKARWIVLKAEYVLAIELLSGCQACDVFDCQQYFAPGLREIIEKLLSHLGHHEEDYLLSPAIEYLRDVIHAGDLLNREAG